MTASHPHPIHRNGNAFTRTMLYLILIFIAITVVASLLGLTDIAEAASTTAKILFFLFLVLFITTLVVKKIRKKK